MIKSQKNYAVEEINVCQMVGFVDKFEQGMVSGWIVEKNELGSCIAKSAVELLCGDRIIGVAEANSYRCDVEAAEELSFLCGFSIPVPSREQGKLLIVRSALSKKVIQGSPIETVENVITDSIEKLFDKVLKAAFADSIVELQAQIYALVNYFSEVSEIDISFSSEFTACVGAKILFRIANEMRCNHLKRSVAIYCLFCLENESFAIEAPLFDVLIEAEAYFHHKSNKEIKDELALPTIRVSAIVDAIIWLKHQSEEDVSLLFDDGFYWGTNYHIDNSDCVAFHYLARGARAFQSPSPFFDPWSYLHTIADFSVPYPYFHFLKSEGYARCHPSYDFLPGFGGKTFPLLAFLKEKNKTFLIPRSSQAVLSFERWRQVAASVTVRNSCMFTVANFFERHPTSSFNPNILCASFKPCYYSNQLRLRGMKCSHVELLAHFFDVGNPLEINPHPLFSCSYYRSQYSDIDRGSFEHFLLFGHREQRTSHPWLKDFSDISNVVSPLTFYTSLVACDIETLSKYFTPQFYMQQFTKIDWTLFSPFDHYISIGCFFEKMPHPAIDPKFLKQRHAGQPFSDNILAMVEFRREVVDRTYAMFDAEAYLERHPDIVAHGVSDPLDHFLLTGWYENRNIAPFSKKYAYSTQRTKIEKVETALSFYLQKKHNYRNRILFVGHEASRTGAPAILLQIVRHFASRHDVDCAVILDKGGPLVSSFEKTSHLSMGSIPRDLFFKSPDEFRNRLKAFIGLFEDNPFSIAICNTAETREYGIVLKELGIRTLTLMHENAELYNIDALRVLEMASDRIVVPADYVRQSIEIRYSPLLSKVVVVPQGLLQPNFGKLRASVNRKKFYREMALPFSIDDVVVIGCGSTTGRKGFDIFIHVAHLVSKTPSFGRPKVKFLWIGGQPRWQYFADASFDSVPYWASWEIDKLGLHDIVEIREEASDVEPFFCIGDIFLLTSRVDPFPCVVHEAMASAMPVVCFDRGSGAPEAIEDAGIIVPFGDYQAMAAAISELALEKNLRSTKGERGRDIVREKYDFNRYIDELTKLLASISNLKLPIHGKPEGLGDGPRVYFTNSDWGVSGVNTFTENLVGFLLHNDVEAEIVFTAGSDHIGSVSPSVPFRVLQPESLSRDDKQNALLEFLKEKAPCVLVSGYDYDTSSIAAVLPPNIGVLGVAHSDDIEHYEHTYRLGLYWNQIVAVSERIKDKILNSNPAFASKTCVVPYGLPTEQSKVQIADDIAMRIKSPIIKIFYAGRFERFQKRIFDYCEVATRLAEMDLQFELVLAGEGSCLQEVRRRLAPLVALGKVRIPGRLNAAEVREELASSHLALLLSDFEGLSLFLVEAMLHGCVPITYAMESASPDIVVHEFNGFVVPAGDTTAVCSAVLEFWNKGGDDRQRLAHSSLETACKSGFRLEDMGNKYLEILRGIFTQSLHSQSDRQSQLR